MDMKDRSSLAATALAVACIASLAASCDLFNPPDPFPAYAGVNLLADYDFTLASKRATLTQNPATPPFVSNADPLDVPAKWDWSWRGRMGDDFQYMTATPMPGEFSDGTTTGDALKIELVNLAVNGDFEGNSPGDISVTGWSTPPAPTLTPNASIEIITAPDTKAINGNTLKITAAPKAGSMLQLQTLMLPEVSTLAAFPFFLHGEVRAYSGVSLTNIFYKPVDYIADPALPDYIDSWFKDFDNQNSGSFIIRESSLSEISSSSPLWLLFGSDFGMEAYFDELRLIRFSNDPRFSSDYSLRLLLRPTDCDPVLIPGRYRLSLWIKRPDFTRLPTEAGANPYASAKLNMEYRQLWGTPGSLFSVPASPSTSWQQISGEATIGDNISIFPEGTTSPVFEIRIIPTDPLTPDAGSVLIAKPELYFLSGL
jgi:hypothetical protein